MSKHKPAIRPLPGRSDRPSRPDRKAPATGIRLEAGPRADDGHRHGYARLSDPEDVAARIAESWDLEFAAEGGTRQGFAAGARARLRHWAAADGQGTRRTPEYLRFRGEVALRISARLEAWVRAGGSGGTAAPNPRVPPG